MGTSRYRRTKREDDMANEWGPLEALIGEWEGGEGGLDSSFSHARGGVVGHAVPGEGLVQAVRTGRQRQPAPLRGRLQDGHVAGEEENPFHTEVGYWLWDGATGEIVRAFAVPRGIAVLAGGTASPDATSFSLRAAVGDARYAIGENTYLRPTPVRSALEVHRHPARDGLLDLRRGDDHAADDRCSRYLLPHTDHNNLHKVG